MLNAPTEIDVFDLWRRTLGAVCGIYVTVRAVQSIQRLHGLLWGRSGRFSVMARQYLAVQLLRTRVRKFAGDLIEIAALTLLLVALLFAHSWL